jgi:hypothetical protein
MKLLIKLILAVLLLVCLLKVPYGYFQFFKIAGFIGFAYLAYLEFKENKNLTAILCACCAILLNPIVKIHFTRKVWNQIDIALTIGLILWIIVKTSLKLKPKS